jgi:hypothetical protein
MITYKQTSPIKIMVYLDGTRVGTIIKNDKGYAYKPTGGKEYGDTYPTLEECKQSLESE